MIAASGYKLCCLPLTGNYAGAAKSYAEALRLCPEAEEIWDSLSVALVAGGRLRAAEAAANRDERLHLLDSF